MKSLFAQSTKQAAAKAPIRLLQNPVGNGWVIPQTSQEGFRRATRALALNPIERIECTGTTIAARVRGDAKQHQICRPVPSALQHSSKMKNYLKHYRHLIALALVITVAISGLALGIISPGAAFLIVGLWQLSQLAISRHRPATFFIPGLTNEQLQDIEDVCRELGELMPQIKNVISDYPDQQRKLDDLNSRVKSFNKAGLAKFAPSGLQRIGNKAFVSDDCARGLASAVILHAAKSGRLDSMIEDSRLRDLMLCEARSFAGITKAMTTAEIPLPVTYGTELIELIAEFGVARQEMLAYPMSGGQNRPPRWGTRPQFGAISMSAQIDEKKPKLEFCDLTSKKLGGIVILPREIDEQSLVPMGRFLAQYGAVEFARAEDTWAFLADGSATYEGVEGLCSIAEDNNKKVVLAAGKTKPSDADLDAFRALRRKVNTAALAGGKYYINQTWEGALRKYNTVNEKVFEYRPDGTATLDGFPIRWVEVLQPYQDTAAPDMPIAVFGRLKFWLMGQRGLPRVDTSEHAFFIYDQLATRFIEELDFDYLSIEAAAVLKTAP